MEKIEIFKGDDTDFTGNQEIVISIDTDIDITGYTAKFQFLHFKKSFDSSEVETRELHVVIGAEDTKKFPLCEQFATLWLFDTTGKTKTLCNRIPVVVTNRACGVVLADGEIRIRARMKTSWDNISGKPQIDDLPERFTDETMRDKVNELARKVSGRAVAMACAIMFAFSAFCGFDVQTARKGDVYNDQQIVTNVTFDGDAGLGTNDVRDIVRPMIDGASDEVYAAATNYTDAATNALTIAVSHPTLLWSASDPKSAACTNRVDSFGNLYKGETYAGGIWTGVLIKDFAGNLRMTFVSRTGNNFNYKPDPTSRYTLQYNADTGKIMEFVTNFGSYTAGTAPTGLDPTISGTDIPVTWASGYAGTFTPQSQPAFATTPYDRFARASEVADISPSDATFSNAVAAVVLPIGTNELAVLREIGGLPVGEGAATVGGLLAALAAAVAWLRRNKLSLTGGTITGDLAVRADTTGGGSIAAREINADWVNVGSGGFTFNGLLALLAKNGTDVVGFMALGDHGGTYGLPDIGGETDTLAVRGDISAANETFKAAVEACFDNAETTRYPREV